MHFMHDNEIPAKHSFNINPDSRKFVDVIVWRWDLSIFDGPMFIIEHTETGVEKEIPVGEYKILVEVSGKDARSNSRQFGVSMKNKDNTRSKIWLWPEQGDPN